MCMSPSTPLSSTNLLNHKTFFYRLQTFCTTKHRFLIPFYFFIHPDVAHKLHNFPLQYRNEEIN